jgi:serine transporter
MIVQNLRKSGKEPNHKKVEMFIIAFFILTLWGTAVINPSILGMIESMGGPIIATILFIMPMYAIKRVPAMAKYQGHISNVFVAVMGMTAISAILYQLLG